MSHGTGDFERTARAFAKAEHEVEAAKLRADRIARRVERKVARRIKAARQRAVEIERDRA